MAATGIGPCPWARWSVTAVEIVVTRNDREIEVDQIGEGMGEPGRAEFVSDLTSLPVGADEPAPAKAGQVVRDVRAPRAECVGNICGIGSAFEEQEKNSTSRGVGEGGTDATEGVNVFRFSRFHDRDSTRKHEFIST